MSLMKLGIGAGVILAVLGSLAWFAHTVRKAEQARIANQTVKELQERGKLNANTSKLDMRGICTELELDVLPDGSGCQ